VRQVVIGHVQVQLAAAPGLPLALAVLLGARVTGLQQVGQILVQAAFRLALQSCWLVRDWVFSFGGLQRGLGLFLDGLDGSRVRADVPGDLVGVAGFDHRVVNALRQLVLGEDIERTREGCFRGNLPERLPTASKAGKSQA